jgi:formyltetrahydrofolate deformylase
VSFQFYVLTISCPDRIGIVSRVSTFLASNECMIKEANHHADGLLSKFFMRIEISSINMSPQEFEDEFSDIAGEFDMEWTLSSLKP